MKKTLHSTNQNQQFDLLAVNNSAFCQTVSLLYHFPESRSIFIWATMFSEVLHSLLSVAISIMYFLKFKYIPFKIRSFYLHFIFLHHAANVLVFTTVCLIYRPTAVDCSTLCQLLVLLSLLMNSSFFLPVMVICHTLTLRYENLSFHWLNT